MPIESVMPSNHLIHCCPLLHRPSVFPSIRVFSSVSSCHFRWPKYWSFTISPYNEYSMLISFRIDWFESKGLSRVLCTFPCVWYINITIMCFFLWLISIYLKHLVIKGCVCCSKVCSSSFHLLCF